MQSIIGHETVCAQLKRLAGLSTMPQSFLLAGPRRVGKALVAQWFARTVIGGSALSDEREPLDLRIVTPELVMTAKQKRERSLSVDTVRDIKHFLSLTPSEGRRRVVIIDTAEKLGVGAANALLKILEEPPAQSLLILVTAEPEHLLPTLRSRLFPVYFRPLSSELLRRAFPEAHALPQFFFDLGLPGIIVEALQYPNRFTEKKEHLRNLFQISRVPLRSRIALAELLAQDELLTRDLLEIWSLGLVFQARTQSEREARGRYMLIAEVVATLRQLIQGEGAPRGVLEKLLLRFP